MTIEGWFESDDAVDTIHVMSSWSVYITTLFLGRFSPLSGKSVIVHIILLERQSKALLRPCITSGHFLTFITQPSFERGSQDHNTL